MSGQDFKPQSEMFPWLSHKVRQPLNSVVEAVASLEELPLPRHQKAYVAAIRRASDDLVMLVNDVLDLTRIEEGNFRLLPARFDLRSALDTCAEHIRQRAREDGRDLTVRIHPETPTWVWGDPGRLKHALSNLALTALRHTHAHALFLDIVLERETESDYRVLVTLEDPTTAPPRTAIMALSESTDVPPSVPDTDRIAFIQWRHCIALARMMGAQVGVESSGEHGGAVWVRFILPKEGPHESDVDLAGPVVLPGSRVLLYDDDESDRTALCELLRRWGCVVTASSTASETIEFLNRARADGEPFHLIVLSTREHGQPVEDLGRTIKGDADNRVIPVIAVAGVGRRGDAARMREIGFDAYLTRPLYDEYLHRCVALTLQRDPDITDPDSRPLITRHSLQERDREDLRVLVVDADPVHQVILKRTVEKLGGQVIFAEQWEAAQQTLDREHFHLGLVSTATLTDAARSTVAHRTRETNIPWPRLVALFDESTEAPKPLEAEGFVAALPRPVSPNKLASLIRKLCPGPNPATGGPLDLRAAKDALTLELRELLREFDGDAELLRDVGQRFREEMDACWKPAEEALQKRDVEAFLPVADRLLQSSYSMGVPRFQKAFESLVEAGRHGNWGTAQRSLQHARRLFGLIEQWLENL